MATKQIREKFRIGKRKRFISVTQDPLRIETVTLATFTKRAVNIQRDEMRSSHDCLPAEWAFRDQETAYPKLQPRTSHIFNRTRKCVFERISRIPRRNGTGSSWHARLARTAASVRAGQRRNSRLPLTGR
jgi:hypothetical protein